MRLNIYKFFGRGLTISVLALCSLSAIVYHDVVIAAGENAGASNDGKTDGRSDNASGTNRANSTLSEPYKKWLSDLLKE